MGITPGVVMITRVSNQTGTEITYGPAQAMDIDSDAGYRWATLCEKHGRFMVHRTQRLARSHAADPVGWCPDCAARNGGYQYGGYLIRGGRKTMFVSVYWQMDTPDSEGNTERLWQTGFMNTDEAIRWIDREGYR